MPVDVDAPPSQQEQSHRQTGLSKWMAGLKEALPNPTVGAGAEPTTETKVDPDPPAAAPVVPAAEVPPKPAAEVKPPEQKPATEQPTDETRWPRSAKEWKNFTEKQKAKTDEFQKQIAERDAKIKEFESKAAAPVSPEVQKQIEALTKENDSYSKELRLLSVTSHPRFKQYFESKTTATLAQLKSCVPADQLDSVTKLVQQPDSEARNEAIDKLLEDMSPLQAGRFLGVINNLAGIQVEKDSEIARAQQDYEQMTAQAKAQQEQRQAQFNQMLDTTIKSMQDAKTGRPEYQLREGETEWNASVAKRLESGKKLISGNLATEVMFKAAFDAAAYPDVLNGYRAALAEVDKLKKQITSMQAANPTVQSTKRTDPTNGTGTTPHLPKDARPMDYTQNWVKKFGETMRGEAG